MSLLPFAIVWLFLVAVVILLAFYRWVVASHEDETVHVSAGGINLPDNRAALGKKVERIELWGKTLTAVAAVYGLVLLSIYVYELWMMATKVQ